MMNFDLFNDDFNNYDNNNNNKNGYYPNNDMNEITEGVLIMKLVSGETIISEIPSSSSYGLSLNFPFKINEDFDQESNNVSVFYTPWIFGSNNHQILLPIDRIISVTSPSPITELNYCEMVLSLIDDIEEEYSPLDTMDYLEEFMRNRNNYLN